AENSVIKDFQISIAEKPGYDVYGQRLSMDITESVSCPVCTRQVAVTRFAPHLEKCMGLKTSRVARIKKYFMLNYLIRHDGLSLSQKNADDGDDVQEDDDYDSLEQMDQDDTYSERKSKINNNTNRRRKKKDEDNSNQSQAIE
ncbi:hypothetical protein ROZALSC1DRAFT_28762, partial [Rozella allomycis CSF55]